MAKMPMTKLRATYRTVMRTALACWSVFLLFVGSTNATAQAPGLAPNYWQQRMFFVPYQVNRQDPAFKSIAKVQLLLSRDGVSDWRVLEEAQPNVQGFSYLAPEDGEYWFALRHLDQRGQPWPAAAVQPQMRVVVDTAKPVLELTVTVDATGAVAVRYEARDPSLRPESIAIEIRPTGGTWSAFLPTPDVTDVDRTAGHASWTPSAGTATAEVRGTVLDKAGHRGEATTTVTLSRPAPSTPLKELPPDMTGDPMRLPPVASTQEWPADNKLPSKPTASQPLAGTTLQPPPETNPYSAPEASADHGRTPARLVGEGAADFDATRLPAEQPKATETAAVDTGVRTVNAKTFDVEYDLESAGPWGVAKVELWGTADNGRTWNRFAVDNDNRSPVRVTVPREGEYGFRIVVDGGNSSPASGDQPELVVAIDVTPPKIEKFSAELGKDDLAGQVRFQWSASDTNVTSQPMGLFYSSFPSGPWTTIATGIENTGSYIWRLERHVPDRFYVKLEARDAAGNVAAHQLPTPLRLERPKATGRLRGIKPIESEAQRTESAERSL